jgi:hypothetical protein
MGDPEATIQTKVYVVSYSSIRRNSLRYLRPDLTNVLIQARAVSPMGRVVYPVLNHILQDDTQRACGRHDGVVVRRRNLNRIHMITGARLKITATTTIETQPYSNHLSSITPPDRAMR